MVKPSFGKIITCWGVLTFVGISSFVYSKRSVNARRLEDMRIRQRMRDSNVGEYDLTKSRYYRAKSQPSTQQEQQQ